MEPKLIMFSILKLKYDRLRTSNSEVELDITEKADATVKLTKSQKCLVRIKVEVNITPAHKLDDSESMIVLSTTSDYEFPEEPQKEDIDPYVVVAINATRKTLKAITNALEITPLELDEISVTDFNQM